MIPLLLALAAHAASPCVLTVHATEGSTPVDGATVYLRHERDHVRVGASEGTTDAAGLAVFSDLTPGWYAATALATDRVPGSAGAVQCTDGEALTVGVTLQAAEAFIDGTLVSGSGERLAGDASIVDTSDHAVFSAPAFVPAPDGTFRIGVRAGHGYNVYGYADGHRWGSTVTLFPAPGQRLSTKLTLPLLTSISGVAIGPDGAPVSGAQVFRHPITTDAATTDDTGAFTTTATPGYVHRVAVLKGDLVGITDVGRVEDGVNAEGVRVYLKPGRTVTGSVVDADSGKPVGPTTVVWSASGTGLVVEVPVAADGTFTARGVPHTWAPDPNLVSSTTKPGNVRFFVHDNGRRSKAIHADLSPSDTRIVVPFEAQDIEVPTP